MKKIEYVFMREGIILGIGEIYVYAGGMLAFTHRFHSKVVDTLRLRSEKSVSFNLKTHKNRDKPLFFRVPQISRSDCGKHLQC